MPPAPTGFTDAETTTTMFVSKATLAEADLVLSDAEVAVMVTMTWLAGGVPGAVYVVGTVLCVEVGETLPHGAMAQVTVQVTPLLAESFTIKAVKLTMPPATTLLLSGVTDTETGSDCGV